MIEKEDLKKLIKKNNDEDDIVYQTRINVFW